MIQHSNGSVKKGGFYILSAIFLIVVVSVDINACLQWRGLTDTFSTIISYIPIGFAILIGGVILLKRLGLDSTIVYVMPLALALCFVANPIIRLAFQQLGLNKGIASTISDILLALLYAGFGGILYIAMKKIQKQ